VSRNLSCILQLHTPRQAVICDSYRFVVYTKPDCPLCDGLKVCHSNTAPVTRLVAQNPSVRI
jgi:hypothetical protein